MKILKSVTFWGPIVLILLLTIFVTFEQESSLLKTVLSVATFLFGIFVSFSISDRHGRVNRIRENDSIERSQLIMLHLLSKSIGPEFNKKMLDSIDQYLMATFDYKIWDYYKTQENFEKLADTAIGFEFVGEKQKALFSKMLDGINEIGKSRKQTIAIIDDKLSVFEWSTISSLATIIFLAVLSLNSGTPISYVVISILLTTIFLLISLLYRFDNLSWKENEKIFEPYQKTFDAIGLPRYYIAELVRQDRMHPPKNVTYRSADWPNPYPDLSGKKIDLKIDK